MRRFIKDGAGKISARSGPVFNEAAVTEITPTPPQVRLGRVRVPAVLLRGTQATADVFLRRHGAVLRVGCVHRERRPGRPGPVGPVRRHAVRIQQLTGFARVPVDADLRTAVHVRPGGRRLPAGVLQLPAHVRRAQSVPVRAGRPVRGQRLPDVRRRVPVDGRLRVLRCAGNVGQDVPRGRGLLRDRTSQKITPIDICVRFVWPSVIKRGYRTINFCF